ncbi:MAG: glutamate synthase subunit beta [Candidatus Izimaplasma bacterium HR2]|nr:MAG: glutamate synthase subunit beta [Candidatus Izimaplasma bacterium HR2]
MLIINQLKVSIKDNTDDLSIAISKKLRTSKDNINHYKVIKRSIDARKKHDIYFVYRLFVDIKNESTTLSKNIVNVEVYKEDKTNINIDNVKYNKNKKIAIIGFGPAGMFSALHFMETGIKVTVFERGQKVENRIKSIEDFQLNGKLNTDSNIQFGEGGAGTFSDGKLTSRSKDKRGRYLFEEFVKAGAPNEILYVHNPHIGTDKLINVVKNIRLKLESFGSLIKFNHKVSNIVPKDSGILLTVNEKEEFFDYVILATGHSARDTIEMLYNNNCDIVQKPFAVGFRIEHKQTMINKSQFGESYNNEKLGAAEYKLTHQTKSGKGVYTFCMCPGGLVVPSSSEVGMLCVNGMSEYNRDKVNANSALLVTVNESDFNSNHPLAGIKYQREIEKKAYALGGSNYYAPIQTVGDFINNIKTTKLGSVLPSYSIGVTYSNLRSIYSDSINNAFIEAFRSMGNKLKGFNNIDALLTGVESRSSSPVRIVRDKDTLQSTNFKNLYPTGEGAGYAGGIVSAGIDGIKVASLILEELKID